MIFWATRTSKRLSPMPDITGSVYESAYHGVPVVAVPLFADQFANAKKVEQFGLGIAVDHETVDVHQLFKTIERVATEPR